MKLDSGKLVIAFIVTAAVAAAGGAWWHQFQQGRRALEYWGSEGALLIRSAPQVELMRLAPEADGEKGEPASQPSIAGQRLVDRRDLSEARGLVHARQALISDPSFLWQDPPGKPPRWEYALRFQRGEAETTILFDLDHATVKAADQSTAVKLGPTLNDGLRKFFEENLR